MKTTAEDLTKLYDSTITLLQEKVDNREATAADLQVLVRLLEKADILELIRKQPGTAEGASKTRDLPFPATPDIDPGEFPELHTRH